MATGIVGFPTFSGLPAIQKIATIQLVWGVIRGITVLMVGGGVGVSNSFVD
jgi:hypothetical protein